MNEKPTLLDLFSGIGGFSLAFEREGFQTIGFSEIDPYASAVLRKHWPSVPNYGDLRNVPAIPCDVLTGGFPCQPFSVSGKQRGADDDRFLWPEMLAVITRCQPTFVLGENVPGLVAMELDRCLFDLEAIGYTCRPLIIPACAVDAKHRRDRLWILAYSEHNGLPVGRRASNVIKESGRWGAIPANEPRCVTEEDGAILAHADGAQRQGDQRQGDQRQVRTVPKHADIVSAIRWEAEPRMDRVADGIPYRAHRLKCLGNSIVPQVAQIFAQGIKQMLTAQNL